MHRRRRLVIAALLPGVFASYPGVRGTSNDGAARHGLTRSAPQTNGAKKDGWWIKVRKDKQESPTIAFSIGSSNQTVEAWMTWNSSDSLEFDVPAKFRNINPLYIKAQSSGHHNGWFCMMYKDAGVKHLDFDDDEDQEKRQSDRDDECKFSN